MVGVCAILAVFYTYSDIQFFGYFSGFFFHVRNGMNGIPGLLLCNKTI
jgi:hypothetical protein